MLTIGAKGGGEKGAGGAYLNNDGSEGLHLLHWTGSETGSSVWIEHNQVDLALHTLHQLDQPACIHHLQSSSICTPIAV